MTNPLTDAARNLLSSLGFDPDAATLSRGEIGAVNQVSTKTAYPAQHEVFRELLHRLKALKKTSHQQATTIATTPPPVQELDAPKKTSASKKTSAPREKKPLRGFQYAKGLFEEYHESLASDKPWTSEELIEESGARSEFRIVRKAYLRWCARTGVEPLSAALPTKSDGVVLASPPKKKKTSPSRSSTP